MSANQLAELKSNPSENVGLNENNCSTNLISDIKNVESRSHQLLQQQQQSVQNDHKQSDKILNTNCVNFNNCLKPDITLTSSVPTQITLGTNSFNSTNVDEIVTPEKELTSNVLTTRAISIIKSPLNKTLLKKCSNSETKFINKCTKCNYNNNIHYNNFNCYYRKKSRMPICS